jgi:diguanylate cyclase (GGDEF)-like protein/PAS domain S-box-containing protein
MGDRSRAEQIGAAVARVMADPVAVIGGDASLIWANPAAEARFGWSLDRLEGQALDGFVHPDDHETALLSLASVATKAKGTLIEIRIRDRSGTYSWFEVRGAGWADGPVPGTVVLNLRESTDRRHWELGHGDPQVLATVLDVMPTITMLLGPDGTIRGANRAVTRTLHRALEETIGTSFTDLVAPADRPVVDAAFRTASGHSGTQRLEASLLSFAGDGVPMSLRLVDLLADRAVRGLVVAATDITSLVAARSQLHHLANHDDLTGLPNRSQLRTRLDEVLDAGPRPCCTLLFGDVDGLKPINDRFGHRAGDAVLAEVATRLQGVLRVGDFVARVSGDEFVMLLFTEDPSVVAVVQQRIDDALLEPIVLPDGTPVTVSMSTGAAAAQPHLTADDLLAAADAAMYVTKRERPRA